MKQQQGLLEEQHMKPEGTSCSVAAALAVSVVGCTRVFLQHTVVEICLRSVTMRPIHRESPPRP